MDINSYSYTPHMLYNSPKKRVEKHSSVTIEKRDNYYVVFVGEGFNKFFDLEQALRFAAEFIS